MPTALYLYNSQDTAADDFYRELKPALNGAHWESKSDYDEGLTGETGDCSRRLTELIRQADAIVFAIGPRGPGAFQRSFELGQVLRVKQEAERAGRRWPVVIALINGAQDHLIPDEARNMTAIRDNDHRAGGTTVLAGVFRGIVGADLPKNTADEPRIARTSEAALAGHCAVVAKRARRQKQGGLTIFIGPYAATDVHGGKGPSDLGRAVLRQGSQFTGADQADLLTHPWIASGAVHLEQGDLACVSDAVRAAIKAIDSDLGSTPLLIEEKLAALAKSWLDVKKEPGLHWRGLLLVSSDQSHRLENALWKAEVPFDRLQCLTNGAFVHERADTGRRFVRLKAISSRDKTAGSTEKQPEPFDFGQILVLKLNGSIHPHPERDTKDEAIDSEDSDASPALTTIEHLIAMRGGVRLPDPLPRHVQTAAFVMLGGGLLNPIVNHAFANHLFPYFKGWGDISRPGGDLGGPPRLVAFHDYPGWGDSIRRFELHADVKRLAWPMTLFQLERIDWPLPDLISRLVDHLLAAPGVA